MSDRTEVSMEALTRLFGDEFEFAFEAGATAVRVVLRGEVIATVPLRQVMYPGDSLTLTLGERVWKFRVPRWSMKLRLEQIEDDRAVSSSAPPESR